MLSRKNIVRIAIGIAAVVGAVMIALPTRPSSANVEEAKLFCGSIGPATTLSEIVQRARQSQDQSVKTEAAGDTKLLVHIHQCHCWVSFSKTGTTASEVSCNG